VLLVSAIVVSICVVGWAV